MTISKVMGATTYSTVMNVADTDIANVMGVAQGGGGGATLLEGFEVISGTSLLYTGALVWNAATLTSSSGITRTTSNVTQGTYSWRMLESSFGGGGNSTTYSTSPDFVSDGIDLSAYSFLEIDYTVSSIASTANFGLACFDLNDFSASGINTIDGATGTGTLSIDLSLLTGKTNCAIIWGCTDNGSWTTGGYDVYIDNLRAS